MTSNWWGFYKIDVEGHEVLYYVGASKPFDAVYELCLSK